MTEYVVLHYIDHEDTWRRLSPNEHEYTIRARSAEAAIRDWMQDETLGGTFVAVPARSWRPFKVRVETALKFSS